VKLERTLAALVALAVACVGTTGGDIIDFPVFGAGPAKANSTKPFEFVNDRGWHVVLTRAVLHVGALYLGQNMPVSGAQNTSCILPGTYVAQVTTGLDVNLLSSTPTPFPSLGRGTTLDARVAQVWLTGVDINETFDPKPILAIEGTADKDGDVRPFSGKVSISSNRQTSSGQLAGANPICKQRIVSPIPTSLSIGHEGALVLRIDPRFLFVNVDFGQLGKFSSGYGFSDDPSQTDPKSPLYYSQPSANLYQNLHAAGGLYAFSWEVTP